MSRMVVQYVKPSPGERILDVGCGYGDLFDHLFDVDYVGIDLNNKYISYAGRHHKAGAEFMLGDISDLPTDELGRFDAVVAIGVLHHLTDSDATCMLRSVANMLNPQGRFIAAEPVWESTQRTTARVLAALDRGRYVREELRYRELLEPWFSNVECDIRHDLFWFPYTHCMIRATLEA
jgi:2-polyprenyl-3-methyl-5-hydroxy-6-metoxy-1,4-benzoquinol methylase